MDLVADNAGPLIDISLTDAFSGDQHAQKWQDASTGAWFITAFIVFCMLSAPLAFSCGPQQCYNWPPLVGFWLYAWITMSLLWMTQQLDPGVVNPSCSEDPLVVALNRGEAVLPVAQYQISRDNRNQFARRRVLDSGVLAEPERWCTTCNIWRGHRTTHCSKCGFCMERFDHHCGVLGTCIARNNHRFFATFLLFAGVGTMILAYACMTRLQELGWPSNSHEMGAVGSILLCLFCMYAYTSCISIFGFMHCSMVCFNQTTKEQLQRGERSRGIVRSCTSGWVEVWCAPMRWKYGREVGSIRNADVEIGSSLEAPLIQVAPVASKKQ